MTARRWLRWRRRPATAWEQLTPAERAERSGTPLATDLEEATSHLAAAMAATARLTPAQLGRLADHLQDQANRIQAEIDALKADTQWVADRSPDTSELLGGISPIGRGRRR